MIFLRLLKERGSKIKSIVDRENGKPRKKRIGVRQNDLIRSASALILEIGVGSMRFPLRNILNFLAIDICQ
jgi:hypothetical protein